MDNYSTPAVRTGYGSPITTPKNRVLGVGAEGSWMGAGNTDDTTEETSGGQLGGRPKPLVTVVIRGAPIVGEHGPEWKPPEVPRHLYSAITACGYEILFASPPVTGEEIYCRRCQDWERCRVVGGVVVQCADCDLYEEHGQDRKRAVRQARTHALGKRGKARIRHRTRVGTHTREGIEWEPYRGISDGCQG